MKILLDTHILIWWYLDDPKLPSKYAEILDRYESAGDSVALSDISVWEIAKLVELRRLKLTTDIDTWLTDVVNNPSIEMLRISPAVAIESTRLGDGFHKDPSDQIIVATARIHNMHLMTVDKRIIESKVALIV